VGTLKRMGTRVIAPVSAVEPWVQAAVVAATLVGGGVVLGVTFGPGIGVAIALGGLLLLTGRAAWALQREVESAQDRAPRVEFAGPWHKEELLVPSAGAGGGSGEWAEVIGFDVRNCGGAEARNLWAEIELLPPDASPMRMQGRWSHNPPVELREPFEAGRFTRIDLPPNAQPEPVDVAIRFKSDGAVFGMNTRNLFSGGRHGIFALPGPEFVARARVRGDGGIDIRGEWRCSGDSFQLTPVVEREA
jgi:hypothetical protein